MPWIQNTGKGDVRFGSHLNAGEHSMLIQIVDPCSEFPTPARKFKEVHQFEFLDTEDADNEFAITDAQASELVNLLTRALDESMNVIVHCHAGICRSGAVCEVGVVMGFEDTEVFRSPNLRVKHKMMQCLGLTYSDDELHTVNGYTTESGIILPKVIDWANDNEKVFILAEERRIYRQNRGE